MKANLPRSPSPTASPLSHPDHGRIQLWMGGGVRTLVSEGRLVERSCWSSYQLSRSGDCFLHIPEVAVWNTCPVSDRQHHGDALSEQVGRTRSRNRLVRGILWCQTLNISLTAVHISGCDNVEADCLSRHRVEHPRCLERSTEWSLDQDLLFDLWGVPIVDLFTTRLNTKMQVVYLHLPDPIALPGNPLQVDWSQGLLYM